MVLFFQKKAICFWKEENLFLSDEEEDMLQTKNVPLLMEEGILLLEDWGLLLREDFIPLNFNISISERCCAESNRRLGGARPGNRFVSFVRAYARSGCLVKFGGPAFSLFPFGPG